MGEKITYVISIKSDSVSEAKGGVASDKNGQSVSSERKKSESGGRGGAYVKSKLRKVASVGFAMQAIDMAVSAQINTVEARTGNARLAELQSYTYSTAKSLVGATVAGAMAGGVPGAVIGLTGALVHRGVQVALAQQQLDIAKSVENVGLQMAHIRAGTGGSRHG